MKRLYVCLIAIGLCLPLDAVGSLPVVTGAPGWGGPPTMPWSNVPDLEQYFVELDSQGAGFVDNLRQGIVEGADSASGVLGDIEDALKIAEGFADHDSALAELDGFSDLAAEFASDSELLELAGEYAGVLSSVLDAIKWGNLVYELQDTLLADDRDAFGRAFSEVVRELFVDGASKLGQKGGAKVGLVGLKGGPLVLVTVPVGAIAGGRVAKAAATSVYDAWLIDGIEDLGRQIHDRVHGADPGAVPSVSPPDVPLGPSSTPPSGQRDVKSVPVQPLR